MLTKYHKLRQSRTMDAISHAISRIVPEIGSILRKGGSPEIVKSYCQL